MSADDSWIGGNLVLLISSETDSEDRVKGMQNVVNLHLLGSSPESLQPTAMALDVPSGRFNFMYCTRTLGLSGALGFYLCYISAMCERRFDRYRPHRFFDHVRLLAASYSTYQIPSPPKHHPLREWD